MIRSGFLVLSTVGVAAFAAILTFGLVLDPFGEQGKVAVSDVGTIAAVVWAAAASVLASIRSQGRARGAWTLIGVGLAAWAFAEVMWGVYELALDRDAPFPSVADIGYLGAIPLTCAGLILLASPHRSLARLRTILDGTTLIAAGSAIVWHALLMPIYTDSEATLLEKTITAAYPLGDLLLLFGIVILLSHNRSGHGGTVVSLFAAGIAVFLLSDLGYAYLEVNDLYSTGSLFDLGWAYGYLLMGSAATVHAVLRPDYGVSEDEPRSVAVWRQALPLLLVALMFGLALVVGAGGVEDDIPALVLGALAVGAALLRQAVVLQDNAALNGALARTGEVLESRVRERTAELSRLASILEATTDLVATTDTGGNALYLNRAGRRMLAVPETADLSGRRFLDLHAPWARTVLEQDALPAALRSGSWEGESALLAQEGREIPVSLVLVTHYAPDGSPQFLSTIARDITERKEFETRLVHLANHDALTDLFNRRRFEEEVSRELARIRRFKHRAALLFIDLDGFKYVNDSLGHRAGDELLTQLGDVLGGELRETDVLARLGGDEFAVLLTQNKGGDAETTARRLLGAIRDHRMISAGQSVAITASMGIALAPDHGTTVEELLARADMAMYQAKEERDSFRLYAADSPSQAAFSGQLIWEERIREALQGDGFTLVLQPIRGLQRDATHYEALIRLIEKDGRLVLPQAFLPVAERSALIHAVDRWVVREAIKIIAAAQARGQPLRLEVNLSGKAFADEDLLSLIERELAEQQVDPGNLVFEITETAAIANITQAQRFIQALKMIGCGFAIDDFGVGYSSLYYLKTLPVDYLKIDGSFIKNLPRDVSDQHLVRSIVELARALGKQTIAEFVGDDATVEHLRAMGVDFGQGFHLGEPASIDEILSSTSRRSAVA